MKIYMSYWSLNSFNWTRDAIFAQKSVCLLKRKMGEKVHLITDIRGKNIFQNCGYDSIETSLEHLPKDYSEVFALGKLKAYSILADRGESFFHFDQDFFLLQPLSEDIINADIVFQSPERATVDHYCLDFFYDMGILKDKSIEYAFNCGVVGGKDFNFFKKYCDEAFDLIFKEEYKVFWQTNWMKLRKEQHNKIHPASKSFIVEQYLPSLLAAKENKKISFLRNEEVSARRDYEKYINREKINFLHLFGKTKPLFKNISLSLR